MHTKIIQAVESAGFAAYMRNEGDSWLYFTDGTHIGYLEDNQLRGLCLSTVHVPNSITGTGFRIAEFIPDSGLMRAKLAEAFALAPAWCSGRDRVTVCKWKDFRAFRAANSFNSAYVRVVAELLAS